MSSKLLGKLFWMLAFFCWIMIVQLRNDDNDEQQQSAKVQLIDNEKIDQDQHLQEKFPRFFIAYKNILLMTGENEKLLAIEKALEEAEQENVDDKDILRRLNIAAARIYRSRWHVVFALEKYYKAQTLIFDKDLEKEIENLEDYKGRVEAERGLNEDYVAYKFSGPAKTFTGKILVAYIFVDDGLKTRWSNKTKQQTLQTLSLVQQWQQAKAAEYQVNDIQFINKTFVAKRNPNLVRTKGVSFKSSAMDINQYVASVMQSLGAKNIGEFIGKQVALAGADQGVVYIHSNFDKRSFARLCGYTHKQQQYINGRYQTKFTSKCTEEFVMLMEKIKRNRWDKLHYTQAHETMHVFGAADLYNIKNAGRYAVTDIMNFQSKNLKYSSVEPITAFAIGWQSEPPEAPFKILEK